MKKFEQLTREEKAEITTLIANWLHQYTTKVIVAVLEKRDEIINNEFTVNLLRELKEREEKEKKEFTDTIGWLLRNYEDYNEFDPHDHAITHSKSYRDILYDMYIKNI